MDYSIEYCKMAQKAEDVQSLFSEIKEHSIMMQHLEADQYLVSQEQSITENRFWLPAESQLEYLTSEEASEDYFLFIRHSYTNEIKEIPFNLFRSFEQYRLAYLMKQRFKKYWNGTEWLKIIPPK